jgi:hypothetical protein
MNRRKILFALLCLTPTLTGAALRGRLERMIPNRGRVPASGITVTLANKQRGRIATSVTQQEGMYYLNAPAGAYSLEVWVRGTGGPPLVYSVQVREPYTDIPAIVLP